ncbi:related to acetylesterase [Rhynchosporium agropyri]|uniref:Related to acetylesterase n=2 Tax=Rhynchosporium TaxID=38037 RepID=A0A1E1LLU8_9HELO|nr:related to acetylesterase [Rhynchosporium agropyri]CZT12976.1 related to acetylesterase [Rhynchosporium commune]
MRASFLWQLGLAGIAISSPVQPAKKGLKTPAFFLAGDSTTASGGGWGNGFLTTLVGGANGTNFGHNGATTESFRAGGDWANVTGAVKRASATHSPYVTIQFGHNDQKPIKNITVAEFKVNMKKFAQEVIAAGGTPILVTSLSRRRYVNGSIDLDLVEQVKATLAVASDLKAAVIDLNAASMKYLNAIGETKARTYDKVLDDSTHLNPNAGLVFGNMVAGLILESSVGHLVKPYVKEDASIKAAIAAGKYILPSN